MMLIIALVLSYLLGAIPTAYIFGRVLKGIDIREHGSGNVGATNVFRVLGKGPGSAVLVIDILKGVLAVALISYLFGIDNILALIGLAVVAVCGHNWTVFLQFKGGKGIATSLGGLIGLAVSIASIRPVLGLTIMVFLVMFLLSRYVSLSSMTAGAVLPILMFMTGQPVELILFSILIFIFVLVRHRPNIKRLLAGTESRVPLYGKPAKRS